MRRTQKVVSADSAHVSGKQSKGIHYKANKDTTKQEKGTSSIGHRWNVLIIVAAIIIAAIVCFWTRRRKWAQWITKKIAK